MESFSSAHRASCCFLLVLLFCFTVPPISAFPDDLDLDLAKVPAMPPAHAPAHHYHHHHLPNPHHHHHSPLHAPAHAPAGHHHVHVHPPAPAPVHAPAKAPAHSPVHPPAHAPTGPHHMPRSFIAVQGVVYCKSCKYAGVDTLLGATPLLGAEVKLECNSSTEPVVGTTRTDKNGYFFLTAPKTVTTYAFHKCKVSLVSSPPSSACKKPSDLHGGLSGATLHPQKPFVANKLPFVLYSVGPLAFEPQCPR